MLFEELIIYPRLAVKTVDIRKRIELYDIFIPRLVLGEHDNVLRLCSGALVEIIVRGIQLAADDVFDPLFDAFLCKIERCVHIAVIGDGTAVDIVFDEIIDEVVHLRRSIQQAVFRMQMQMYKIRHNSFVVSPYSFFSRSARIRGKFLLSFSADG